MRKVLLCAEFTSLHTGYANYYRMLAEKLTQSGFSVVELAGFSSPNNKEHIQLAQKASWPIYFVDPDLNSPEEIQRYKNRDFLHSDAKFGGWIYDEILLQEKPDIVIGLRDCWYDKFITHSPLSKNVVTIVSPTVDSIPQDPSWISMLSKADYVTTYNGWSETKLKQQMRNTNIITHISPAADNYFKLMDKKTCRAALGLPQDIKLIGTVMRNQARKRIPELMEVVARLDNVNFYCHTTYPESGSWNIPNLLLQYGIKERVFFTYFCNSCGNVQARHYSGQTAKCPCGGVQHMPTGNHSIANHQLAYVYGAMDNYVQWHCSEGFGMPTIEAASCGTPVITVDYSAQTDVGKKLDAVMISPLKLERYIQFNAYRAITDDDKLVEYLKTDDSWTIDRKSIAKLASEQYGWDVTLDKWVDLLKNIPLKTDINWNICKDLRDPPVMSAFDHLNNELFVMHCISYVAQRPDLIGSYDHLLWAEGINNKFIEAKRDGALVRPHVNRQYIYEICHKLYMEQLACQN